MNYLFKICLVGDSGTGKTTFIESLIKNFYYESREKTIGIDFFTYTVDDIKFQIWDTSGNIMFIGIVRSYFHDASGILLFFCDKKSFDNIDNWVCEIRKINQKCKIILIQTASDFDLNVDNVLPEMMKLLVHKKAVSFNNTTDYIKMDGDLDGDGDDGDKSFCDKCIVL